MKICCALFSPYDAVDVPIPGTLAEHELAVERRRHRVGVDLLVERPLPGLDQAARDERIIRGTAVGLPSGLTTGLKVTPNGLYGLVTSNDNVSNRLPAPLPASGPMNKGSNAAWFCDVRRLKLRRDANVGLVEPMSA